MQDVVSRNAGHPAERPETCEHVHIDPENWSQAQRLSEALWAEMCKQGAEYEEPIRYEIKAHMRAALTRYVAEEASRG